MNKKFNNECFRVAVDYLYSKNAIKADKELAEKIDVTPATLSRIRKDHSSVSDDTLRKMNDAFGGIFNMAYFRGESPILLVQDIKDDHPIPSQPESDILELYARMIRKLDDTRVELQKEIAEVRQLKDELRQAINHLNDTTYQIPDEAPRLAAEDIKTK
jgi:transcriptional regulator with XRE-family HTH domain